MNCHCPYGRHSLKRTATQTQNPRNGFALHLQASDSIRCLYAPAVWRASFALRLSLRVAQDEARWRRVFLFGARLRQNTFGV